MIMAHDSRGITYNSETREEALESKRFYQKHGARVVGPFLSNKRFRYPNRKNVQGRYWQIVVYHPSKGYKMAARGYHGKVKRPTAFIVGERGPERVNITPIGKHRRAGVNLNVKIGNFGLGKIGNFGNGRGNSFSI